MKTTTFSLLALASIAMAQTNENGIPGCAVSCFEKAIANSNCSATDFYCQCTGAAQQITTDTIKCLCTSTCSATDLLQVYQASNTVCKTALEAHGETYSAGIPNFQGVCNSPSSGATSASATSGISSAATGAAQVSATITGATAGSGEVVTQTTSSAGAAATGFTVGKTAVLIGGLALLAL